MTRRISAAQWIETTSHISVRLEEIEGRDMWVARDGSGTLAMSTTEAGTRRAVRRVVIAQRRRGAAARFFY